jgi:hypothetical protein
VSPSFRDRIVIGLAPESLALVLLERGMHPRVSGSRVVRYAPALGVESWQSAVDALREVAVELKDVKADVTVVLSNHFVRYALVPPGEGLDQGEEELAYARYCFGKIHGARSKSWEVRMTGGAGGSERLASAIDGELLEAVRACFPAGAKLGTKLRTKLRLASVQPYLMSAFNQWRATMRNESAWFLLVEPQRFCLALLENGRWTAVRNSKAELDVPEQWAELLEREQHVVDCDRAPARAYVHAPHRTTSPDVEGWTFKSLTLPVLPGLSFEEAAPLSMALCAA